MLTVSDRALIILAATDGSFAQYGMRPNFISESCRTGFFGCCRTTGDLLGGGDVVAGIPVWFV